MSAIGAGTCHVPTRNGLQDPADQIIDRICRYRSRISGPGH
jgi:hypothetical protein